jgi:hypothetical protein
MENAHFDALVRRLAASRRATFRVAFAGVVGSLLAGRGAAEVLAGCKKVGKKCDKSKDCCDGARCRGGKKGKCRCKAGLKDCPGEKNCTNLDTDLSHCGACGNVCEAGEACCAGACTDLQTDANNCSACGQACGGSNSCVAGVCTTADGCPVGADACAGERVICPGGQNCVCSRSTEGETICGDAGTPGAICGQCATSADCASFGAGAFCSQSDPGGVNCCGPSAQNACRLPCVAV